MNEADRYTEGSAGEPAAADENAARHEPAATHEHSAAREAAGAREMPRGSHPESTGRPAWQHYSDQRFDPRHKSPALAAVLSVFPGLGQLYIGYYVRGFAIAAVFLMLVMISASNRDPVGPVMAMFAMFFWGFNIIDAGRMAALYNHFTAGADTIQMPQDFRLPKMGGSILGGAVLLAFGGIALSNTAFGYPLDWLEDWWPIFPLALGAYLLARGAMDYMAGTRPSPPATSDLARESASFDD